MDKWGETCGLGVIWGSVVVLVLSSLIWALAWYNVSWLRNGYCQQSVMNKNTFADVKCDTLKAVQ